MSFLNALNISGSALTAQKFRMDVISSNIANASTTRTEEGGPYRRKMVVFQPAQEESSFSGIMDSLSRGGDLGGVEVSEVVEDADFFKAVYNPNHPDADEDGYVMMPNIDTVEEMVDMMSATRSYEANVTVFNAVKLMAVKALEIGK